MSIVGMIPARGGSKRIPRKNLVPCGGKPLIAHTFEAAKSSRHVARVILSTDDPEIVSLARQHGIEVPFMRPAHLAVDGAPMLGVLQHFVAWFRANIPEPLDAIVLLQPTSPLRTARHIDEAIEVFRHNSHAASVVSVVAPPHIFHPLKMLKPGTQGLVPYIDGVEPVVGHRDLPQAYGRNGPAVLIMRPELIDRGAIYGSPCLPYVMDAETSVDIDTALDLDLADLLLRRRSQATSQ